MLRYLSNVLYVQLSPERLTVRNAKTGEAVSEVPEIAISDGPRGKLIAVGAEARALHSGQPVNIVNPFAHPRTLVSDFTLGQQVLKAFLQRIGGQSIFTLAPEIVMHPQGNTAGGLTQIEIRTLHEMALGAGASQVKVWQGRLLTDQELLSRQFPSEGQVLS
ncbi:MAG: rod shape-determining protein [Burkholderiaceae bacterium]